MLEDCMWNIVWEGMMRHPTEYLRLWLFEYKQLIT